MDKISLLAIINLYMYSAVFMTGFYAVYSFLRRRSRAHSWFSYLCISIAIYSLGYIMELNVHSLDRMIFWNQFQYLGIPFFGAVWILFNLEYYNLKLKESLIFKISIFVIPLITFFIRMTNQYHNLYYTNISTSNIADFDVLSLGKGSWYYVHSAFVTICAIASIFIIVRMQKTNKKVSSPVAFVIMLIILVPYAGIILNILNIGSTNLDFSAISLPLVSALLFYILFKNDFLKFTSFARDRIFDNLAKGVLIINPKFEIVDYNNSARVIFPSLHEEVTVVSLESLLNEADLRMTSIEDIVKQQVENDEMPHISAEANPELLSKVIDYKTFFENYLSNLGNNSKDILVENNKRYYYIKGSKILAFNGKFIAYAILFSEITDIVESNISKQIIARELEDERNVLSKTLMQVNYLNYHDQLTGVYNRRYFEMKIVEFDNEKYLPLSVIMADVNGLKLANDAFGHLIGDSLLREASSIMQANTMESDVFSRVGGDEFVFLMPNTSFADAEKFVKRMTAEISLKKVQNLQLSISFGINTREIMESQIYDVYKKAEDNMYEHKLTESHLMRVNTIEQIVDTLFERLPAEKDHADKVSGLCAKFADKIGMSRRIKDILLTAASLHDIGKVAIDYAIIDTGLEEEKETGIITKRHSEIGYRILGSVNEMGGVANIVLEHHENWDGSGYPKGLNGDEISVEARILRITDSYDAMVNGRKNQKPLTKEMAIADIRMNSGILFDPVFAEEFIDMIRDS